MTLSPRAASPVAETVLAIVCFLITLAFVFAALQLL
jgi:hypothetical protein